MISIIYNIKFKYNEQVSWLKPCLNLPRLLLKICLRYKIIFTELYVAINKAIITADLSLNKNQVIFIVEKIQENLTSHSNDSETCKGLFALKKIQAVVKWL